MCKIGNCSHLSFLADRHKRTIINFTEDQGVLLDVEGSGVNGGVSKVFAIEFFICLTLS